MQNGGEVASIRDLLVELSMTLSYLERNNKPMTFVFEQLQEPVLPLVVTRKFVDKNVFGWALRDILLPGVNSNFLRLGSI